METPNISVHNSTQFIDQTVCLVIKNLSDLNIYGSVFIKMLKITHKIKRIAVFLPKKGQETALTHKDPDQFFLKCEIMWDKPQTKNSFLIFF